MEFGTNLWRSEAIREARVVGPYLSLGEILVQTGMSPLCDQPTWICTTTLRGQPWTQRGERRHVDYGDYFTVTLRNRPLTAPPDLPSMPNLDDCDGQRSPERTRDQESRPSIETGGSFNSSHESQNPDTTSEHDGDTSTLMHIPREPRVGVTLYSSITIYPFRLPERLHLNQQTFEAEATESYVKLHMRRFGIMRMHDELILATVNPQPEDLQSENILGLVAAPQQDLQVWQEVILLDVSFVAKGQQAVQDNGRTVRIIDYHIELQTLYDQVGLGPLCQGTTERCHTAIRGIPWIDDSQPMRIQRGDYVQITIKDPHDNIPILHQLRMAQRGCSLEEMQAIYNPSHSEPSGIDMQGPGLASTQDANQEGEEKSGETRSDETIEYAEAPDEHSLMQRQGSEIWYFLYRHGQNDPTAEALRGEETQAPHQHLRERFRERLFATRTNEVHLADLNPQPPDLLRQRIFGSILYSDAEIIPGSVLVMLDVEIYGTTTMIHRHQPSASDEWREITYVRNICTRGTFLQLVGLEEFCLRPNDTCLLSHRGSLWNLQDQRPRWVSPGDYFIVKIRNSDETVPFHERWRQVHGTCGIPDTASIGPSGQHTEESPEEERTSNQTHADEGVPSGLHSPDETSYIDDGASFISGCPHMMPAQTAKPQPRHCRIDEERADAMRNRDRARRQDVLFYREMNQLRTWIEGEEKIELEIQGLVRHRRDGRFCIDRYGITRRHIAVRTTWVRMEHGHQLQDIMHVIRELWSDTIDFDADIRLLYVDPQPFLSLSRDCLHLIADLMPEAPGQVVLHAVKYARHENDPGFYQFVAARHEGRQSIRTLAHQIGTTLWLDSHSCTYRLYRKQAYMHDLERALLDHGELIRHELSFFHRGGETRRNDSNSLEGIGILEDEMMLIQTHMTTDVHISSAWRPTVTRHAQLRLPPPGNGTKKVSFSQHVRFVEQDHDRTDYALLNTYVQDFCETRQSELENPFIRRFLQDMRFGTDDGHLKEDERQAHELPREGQTGQGLPLTHILPVEEEPIEEDKELHLPIRIPTQEQWPDGEEKETIYLHPLGPESTYPERHDYGKSNDQNLDMAFDFLDWFDSFLPIPDFGRELITWKDSAREWISAPIWVFQPAEELRFYLDGARRKDETAAGVLMYARSNGQWYFGGFMTYKFPETSQWNGIYSAELMAQVIAAKWAYDTNRLLEWNFGQKAYVHFVYDSTSAGLGAAGQYGGNQKNPVYVAARSLVQLLTKGLQIQFQERHQKSHTGEPGNEGADDVATWGLNQPHLGDSPWDRIVDAENSRHLQWLWWTKRNPHYRGKLPFHLPRPEARIDPRVVEDLEGQPPETTGETEGRFDLKIIGYNINSTKDTKKKHVLTGMLSPGKLQAFLADMHYHRIGIFVLQETRLKRHLPRADPNYFFFQSLADEKGLGGIMIGISKAFGPFPHDTKETIGEGNVKILEQDPETLVLRIQDPLLRCVLIGGHAPHSGRPREEVDKWWRKISNCVQARAQNWPIIFAIDANGRIGSNVSDSIGNLAQDMENYGGEKLHEFTALTQTWCPTTFSDCHTGTSDTWTHPSGATARIDFVGIPLYWKDFMVSTKVARDLKAGDSFFDHCPIWLQVQGIRKFEQAVSPFKPIRLKPDYQNCHTIAVIREKLQEHLQIDWSQDVHTHAHEMLSHIRLVTSHAAKQSVKTLRRKSHLSDETWDLIAQKKSWRRDFFGWRDYIRTNLLRRAFDAWSGNPVLGAEYTDHVADFESATISGSIAYLKARILGKQVAKRIRQEDQDFFSEFAERLERFD